MTWTDIRGAFKSAVLSLVDWRLSLLLAIWVVLTLLVAQAPFSYAFNVGQERGENSDLPFLSGFNTAEGTGTNKFRWTKAESTITVPGVGRRGLIVGMDVVSHRAQWAQGAPPTVLQLQAGAAAPATTTLRLQGAHYRFYLPPHALEDGTLRLRLLTEPWQSRSDSRDELGVALGNQLTITSTDAGGFVLPNSALLLGWPLSLALLWLALRAISFTPRQALLLLLPLATLVPLLGLLDAPRLGFGSTWSLQVGLLSLATALVCTWVVPPLLRWLRAAPPAPILRWLLLLMVLSVALKYGGRLYPESMPGDLQLHVNRYSHTVMGSVYIEAQHRGLPFPFPNGLYLLLAPLTLSGLDIRFLFQFGAGLFEATTVLLLYLLLARGVGSPRLGIIAGAIYALTAAGFMTTWFAFETQVATQWAALLLIVVLVLRWPRYDAWSTWIVLAMLLVQVFLGHIGQFINMSLLGLLIVPLLWWRAVDAQERRGAASLLGAGLAAGLFVTLFYYTAFWELVVEQLNGVASGGLNGVTGREPIPRSTTLWVTWQGGLITHFGFFPVLLAVPGVALIGASRLRRSILPPLIWGSFLVSASQALLPLLTLSSITTRWLMFSAWAIAVAGSPGFALLWRRGRSARLVVLAMAIYVCWLALGVFLDAMVLRKPPIEPF